MATNVPPHNLNEVIDACVALIDDESIGISGLMQYLPGPDFPTAALINGARGIREAYQTGRGRIYMRARTEVETDPSNGRQTIIVTELPYQVNKARMIEKIAELVKDKKIEGITELRDESDKDGLRVVIELKRNENAEVILNQLYKLTPLETVFGMNMVALVDGQPRLLSLKEMLEAFLRHRREVVTRRTVFDLRKARDRAHVLEGLAVALANIDEVIATIKASASPAEARAALVSRTWRPGAVTGLLERAGGVSTRPDGVEGEWGLAGASYRLSEVQAQAILDLRLHRLTGLEQDKIVGEFGELLDLIRDLNEILGSSARLLEVIRGELQEIKDAYADPRRTEIVAVQEDVTIEDLIERQDVVVTLSHAGYVKSQPVTDYEAQRRGGRGKMATTVKDEDFVDMLFVAHSHDTMLCFSNHGRCYWLKVWQVPIASRGSRGKPIVNLLPLSENEQITALLPVREYAEGQYVFMATAASTVKKTPLTAFSRPRVTGIIAVGLADDDQLVGVSLTDGSREVLLATTDGKAIRFAEEEVRPMGREAAGVRGIRLASGQRVTSLIVLDEGTILTVSERGYGKQTPVDEFPRHGRAGQGVIAMQTSERNGAMVGALQVLPEDEIMLINSSGTLVRVPIAEVSVMGRNTQGVRLMKLEDDEALVGVERVAADEAGDADEGAVD
jgi:DNA gyrase subunit A